jgi:hypothetical protein
VDTTVRHVPGMGAQGGRGRPPPADIPNYELQAFINGGGFGDVWLARERVTGVRRAIKVLCKSDARRAERDIDGVKRYQYVAQDHPHLLRTLVVGETERCFYCVMDLADNAASDGIYRPTTLRTLIQTRRRFSGRSALELLEKLASAVSRLHGEGLAHYDLKPENILIVQGEPKIADVGLVAPKDQPPDRTGTLLYMTPEGQADDLYALGKILYELITGRPAAEFPRLPVELVQHVRPELAAAVQIVNRACHSDPARRFASVAELERSVAIALRAKRRLSRKVKVVIAAALSSAAVMLALSADAIHARIVPRMHWQNQVPLSLERWSFVGDATASRASLHPYVRFAGTPVSRLGRSVYELAQPLENFFLEARFLSSRPWGTAEIGLASTPDERRAVRIHLQGQPNGVGLHILLDTVGAPVDQKSYIWGHPQPGVEYVLRLARVGDRVALALWPLVRDSHIPLSVVRDLPTDQGAFRYVILEGCTDDALAELELHELRVAEYSAPVWRIDYPLPDEVLRGVQAAWRPEIPDHAQPPTGNLLADPFHPYDSDAWMSVGNWSWWEGAAPSAGPKRIHCVPCSPQTRQELRTRTGGPFDGLQLLRFDHARYGDFDARLRVNLMGEAPAAEEPFACISEDGTIGLAFRLQDAPPAGLAWGGGYTATVTIGRDEQSAALARLRRNDGFFAALTHECAIAAGETRALPLAEVAVPVDRATLLARDGFTLGVRAVGSYLSMTINGQQVLELDDPDGLTTGRIALLAARLMATFDSLEVTPLN